MKNSNLQPTLLRERSQSKVGLQTLSAFLPAICSLILVGGRTLATQPEIIQNSGNRDATFNNPPILPVFTIDRPWKITSIMDYHWNSGQGQDPNAVNGEIAIYDDVSGILVGSWLAESALVGGPPNTWWEIKPNILLDVGSYRIEDSGRDTWSYTITDIFGPAGADWEPYKGFSIVKAVPESSTSATAVVLSLLTVVTLVRRRQQ